MSLQNSRAINIVRLREIVQSANLFMSVCKPFHVISRVICLVKHLAAQRQVRWTLREVQ
jgi:hypothetical protein